MLSKFLKASLVGTSFAPVLLTHSFVLWINDANYTVILGNILIVLSLLILCLSTMKFAKGEIQIEEFPINSIKTADSEIVGFLLAYLLPFTTMAIEQIDFKVMVFIMILFFSVIWSTNSYHINPLLAFVGYHFYEVTTLDNITYLLITKRSLRSTKAVKNVIQLTDYMVLDIFEEEE